MTFDLDQFRGKGHFLFGSRRPPERDDRQALLSLDVGVSEA